MPGTYTLLLALDRPATIAFGGAGDRDLPAGGYAYTGSAFGPGGFARVDRHRELASGERDARQWHVDYLLGHGSCSVVDVVRSPRDRVECAVARRLVTADATEPVAGIGASDCDCGTHLVRAANPDELAVIAREAHRNATGAVA